MKKLIAIALVVSSAFFLFAQTQSQQQMMIPAQDLTGMPDPQLAMSERDYPVTAGDLYTLGYAAGTVPVTYTIVVDPSYKVRVANLALIDASGKTFLALKKEIEAIVVKNYPLSGVQLVLVTPAAFNVTVKGEVKKTYEKRAWALTRLSEILDGELTRYASTRDISVTGSDGRTKTYDLFKAERFGDLTQNPWMRPGDIVTVQKVRRMVTLGGEVERPGQYQLLDGENLERLIVHYGSGLTPAANGDRIEIVRIVNATELTGDKLYAQGITDPVTLEHADAVNVTSKMDYKPVLYLEGALTPDPLVVPESSARITLPFNEGENYASIIRAKRQLFTAVSDTANAYIVRKGERIPLNLNPMLYDLGFVSEYFAEPFDTLVVPFRQLFVTVSGSVLTPGRYPYIPDRDWTYYVGLAGGFDLGKSTNEQVEIFDSAGNKLGLGDPIVPETNIRAGANRVSYYFREYSPLITTTLTIITAVLSIFAIMN